MRPQLAEPEVRELTGEEAEEALRQFAPTEPAPLEVTDFYAETEWPPIPSHW